MNNHWYNEGKEYLKKDDKFDFQGKSKKQYRDSAIFFLISALGFFITFIVAWLFNNI